GADESCGKCTPCRLGSRYAQQTFAKAAAGGWVDSATLRETIACMRDTSLCGHGSGLGILAESATKKFAEELAL
ncbi:MAG TPA: NADH-ubiquinone oxidoreductase-F iron-sulfur binding region domain-containing protein, partial [Fimbriimonas sp.]